MLVGGLYVVLVESSSFALGGMEAHHYVHHYGAAPPEDPHPDSEEEGEGNTLCGTI